MSVKLINKSAREFVVFDQSLAPGQVGEFSDEVAAKLSKDYPGELVSAEEAIKVFAAPASVVIDEASTAAALEQIQTATTEANHDALVKPILEASGADRYELSTGADGVAVYSLFKGKKPVIEGTLADLTAAFQ